MTRAVKKTLIILAIAFAAFYLLSQPENAAEAIRGGIDAVVAGIGQLFDFFAALVA